MSASPQRSTKSREQTSSNPEPDESESDSRSRVIVGLVERDYGWTQDLVVFVIVIISGLIAGFGGWALGSTVHTSDGKFEIGGAIAGLIVIWPALVTIFLRLRKARQAQEESGTKRELEKLQLKHEELKQKYIRSAPCPRGFRISLDENQKIILARPAEWTSRGGVIFDFDGASSKADIVPARFLVHYYPINRAGEIAGGQSNTRQAEEALREAHYQAICRHFAADRYVRVVAQSRIHLGGEPTPLESLYLIMRGYHAVSFVKDPVTGRTTRGFRPVQEQEFLELPTYDPARALEPEPEVSDDDELEEWGEETQQIVVRCYHHELNCVYCFDLLDNMHDIPSSTSKLDRALRSVRFLD